MKRLPEISPKTLTFLLKILIIGGSLVSATNARAGLTLVGSSASSTYAIYSTATNYSSPIFNGSNMLVYPGGGLPALQGIPEGYSTQSQSTNSLATAFTTNATSVPGSPFGYVPTSFGSAETQIFAGISGNQGGFTSQGGVYWSNNTTLADGLPSGSNLASVSFSTATAVYTNNTGAAITLSPGAIISVTGTLGSLDGTSYVAAGISSGYAVYDPTTNTTTQGSLDSVVLASNGGGVNIALKGSGPKEYASVTVLGNVVTGAGTSLTLNPISLAAGDSIAIQSNLTLISDPGSSISVTSVLPPGFPTDPSYLPNFGAFAAATVPEPSSFFLMGAGLTMAGLWARSNRRKTLAQV